MIFDNRPLFFYFLCAPLAITTKIDFIFFPQFHLNGANTIISCTANGQNTHAAPAATNVSPESGNVLPKPMSRALKRTRAAQAIGPVDFANQMRRKYPEMVFNNHPAQFLKCSYHQYPHVSHVIISFCVTNTDPFIR